MTWGSSKADTHDEASLEHAQRARYCRVESGLGGADQLSEICRSSVGGSRAYVWQRRESLLY